jgi:hypothetical protein
MQAMAPEPTSPDGTTRPAAPAGWERRWITPSVRGVVQVAVQVVLSAALFAVLQVLATAHNVRFDMTPTKAFVLSKASRQVAAGLNEDVLVTVFFSSQESGRRREIADLLDQFRAASGRVRYRLLDLDRSPALAQKYGVSSYNTGVIEAAGQVLALKGVDEQEITRVLLRLSRRETRTVCFFTGHGECNPGSTDEREGCNEVAKSIERENFVIRTLTTVPADGVPADCTIAILAGPSHDFLPGEASLLDSHLRAGGRLIILVDPGAPQSIIAFLRTFGVEAGDDVIVDERNRFLGADSFTTRIPTFDQGAFGNDLDTAAVFPVARTLRPVGETAPEGMRVSFLALSSPDSWALVGAGADPGQDVRFRKGIDHPGPLPVAMLVSMRHASGENEPGRQGPGRVIVFGDSDFVTNLHLNLLGNKDLFMSTVAVLAEEPELVAVRSKGPPRGTLSPIALTASQGRVVFWVAVVVQPLFFVVAGVLVAVVRRRRLGGR